MNESLKKAIIECIDSSLKSKEIMGNEKSERVKDLLLDIREALKDNILEDFECALPKLRDEKTDTHDWARAIDELIEKDKCGVV